MLCALCLWSNTPALLCCVRWCHSGCHNAQCPERVHVSMHNMLSQAKAARGQHCAHPRLPRAAHPSMPAAVQPDTVHARVRSHPARSYASVPVPVGELPQQRRCHQRHPLLPRRCQQPPDPPACAAVVAQGTYTPVRDTQGLQQVITGGPPRCVWQKGGGGK